MPNAAACVLGDQPRRSGGLAPRPSPTIVGGGGVDNVKFVRAPLFRRLPRCGPVAPDPIRRLPLPLWLVEHCDPVIDEMIDGLSDEAQQLYRRILADEARAWRPGGAFAGLIALERVMGQLGDLRRRHSGGPRS